VPTLARDQRKWERYPCRATVKIAWGKQVLEGESEDVSFTGLFVATDRPPPLRQLLTVDINHSTLGEIRILAMAVHQAQPVPGRRQGIGIQLFGNDPSTKTRWESFVQKARMAWGGAPVENRPAPSSSILTSNKARPEIRLAFVSPTALRAFVVERLVKGPVSIATDLFLVPGSEVRLALTHFETGRCVGIDAVVGVDAEDAAPGSLRIQAIKLDRNRAEELVRLPEQEPSLDIHVTLDLPSEAIRA
jgi:hypothetical protein